MHTVKYVYQLEFLVHLRTGSEAHLRAQIVYRAQSRRQGEAVLGAHSRTVVRVGVETGLEVARGKTIVCKEV